MARSMRTPTVLAMSIGLALTLAVTVLAYVDAATGHVLADHIRSGYPSYSTSEIDDGVNAYLAMLTVVGVVGVAGWLWSLWTVLARKRWAGWNAAALLAGALAVALTGALLKDTSGEVGLAPLFGGLLILPCVAGVGAVALLWRRPAA